MPFALSELGVTPELGALLMLAALIAGFVDSIAGGGGLITVPALLLAGLSPVVAIATNKLQGTFGVASSTLTFWRTGRIERELLLPLGLSAFVGGVIGAGFAHLLPEAFLRTVVPIMLIGIAVFVAFSPKLKDNGGRSRWQPSVFGFVFGLSIGAYDGAFGPGTGTFYLLGLMLLCGFSMMRAVVHARLMNFGSNLGALLFFLDAEHVLVLLGLAMGLAAALGAYLGARTTLYFGPRLIRPVVVIVSILMALRLLIDPENPAGAWLRSVFA